MKILNQNFKKYIKFFGQISNNWPNDLLGTNCTRLLTFTDNRC